MSWSQEGLNSDPLIWVNFLLLAGLAMSRMFCVHQPHPKLYINGNSVMKQHCHSKKLWVNVPYNINSWNLVDFSIISSFYNTFTGLQLWKKHTAFWTVWNWQWDWQLTLGSWFTGDEQRTSPLLSCVIKPLTTQIFDRSCFKSEVIIIEIFCKTFLFDSQIYLKNKKYSAQSFLY